MKSILNVLGAIVSFFSSIVIYVLVIILLLIISIRSVFSFNIINKLVQNVEVKQVLTDIDDNNDLLKTIYDLAKKIDIDEKSVDSLLNSYDVKYLVSRYIYGGVNYFITGSDKEILTENYFNKYVDKKLNKVIKEAKIEYDKKQIESISNQLVSNSGILLEKLPDIKNIIGSIDEDNLSVIRYLLSAKTILYLILAILVLSALIGLCRFSYYKWLGWLGASVMFASLVCFVIGLLPMFNINSLISDLPSYLVNIINSSTTIIALNFIVIGIVSFIFGALLIIVRYFVQRKIKARE